MRTLLVAVTAFGLSACSNSGTTPVDPFAKNCMGVSCGKGRCVLDFDRPACLCDTNYKADGLSCVPANQQPADKCSPNPCVQPNRSVCSVVDGAAKCACDLGTVEVGGICQLTTKCLPNPCTAANQTMCSVVGGDALCSCNAGYTPVPDAGCALDLVFDCGMQHATGDVFEPDECPMQAREVLANDTWNTGHTLMPTGDSDFYVLATESGHVYQVSASGGAMLGLYVDVYGDNGLAVLGFDHRGTANPVARFKAKGTTGIAYVRVRAFRASDTGTYELSVADLGVDDFEDTTALATPAMVGGVFSGEVQFPADIDVVKVTLTQGRKYGLGAIATTVPQWDAGTPSAALTLTLIDPDGLTVLRRANTQPLGIATRPKADGEYYLSVAAGPNAIIGKFNFTLDDLGTDDHGDVPAEATPLLPSASLAAAVFEIPSDVDVFSFTAVAGHIMSFTCTPQGMSYYSGCATTILDANGGVLATSASSYYGSAATAYEFTTAGTFYARVTQSYAYGLAAIPYSYRLEDLGPDDYGDTTATATAITVGGGALPGRLETPTDLDVFSFTSVADHIYRVTCLAGTGLGQCSPSVVNSGGGVISGVAGTPVVTFETTSAGTLYVIVTPGLYSSNQSGSYSVSVEDLGPDDFGDTLATAGAISPSASPAAATLESPTDVDVFSFTATAPNIFRFTCTMAQSSCQLKLKNNSGAVLQTAPTGYYGYGQVTAVAFEAVTTGTYYVEVTSNGYATTATAYTYRLENVGLDDFGDDAANAAVLTTGVSKSGALETPTDIDAFKFTAVAQHIYRMTCTPSMGLYASCGFNVRNAGGSIVATSNSSASGPTVLSYEAPASGSYTIEVNVLQQNWSFDPYALVVDDIGVDDHGDTTGTATALTLPASQSAVLETGADIDVFSFPVVPNHIYSFTATSSAYVSLRMKDAFGMVVSTSNYSPVTVAAKASVAGTWTVEVYSQSGYGSGGNYQFSAADLGLDDHGNSVATATAIPAVSTPTPGALEYQGDEDFFSITLLGSKLYSVQLGGAYLQVQVYGPTGTALGYEQSAPASFTTGVAGTYYVRVRNYYGGSGSQNYAISVQ